jgi:hypothetical protein
MTNLASLVGHISKVREMASHVNNMTGMTVLP